MKQLLLSLTLLLIATSCSTFKHRTESRSNQTSLQVRGAIRNDSLSFRMYRGSLQLFNENKLEMTEILPVGVFRFHRDSGFNGEAQRIRVYSQQNSSHRREDSMQANGMQSQRLVTQDSLLKQDQELDRESQNTSKSVNFYLYVITASILFVLFWGIKLWRRHKQS